MENVIAPLVTSLLGAVFLYWLIRRLSRSFFQSLTSHWFALGITASFILGGLLFYSLVYFDLVKPSIGPFETAVRYCVETWLLGLIPLNLIILPLFYWRDKSIALKQDNHLLRIPENALHALTFCGGYLGAWIGQKQFKHKTSKSSFKKKHYVISLISLSLYILAAYIIVVFGDFII